MADVGNPFGWGLKPEFPVLNWNHPLAAQLVLDVTNSFLGGTEIEGTTGILGATAGLVVGNGQNGPVHVYSGGTAVDTYTGRGLITDARHISFEVVAFVAGAGGGGGFPRAFDGNLNLLLNEGSGLFNFQQNGWSGGASNIDGPAYPVGSWFQVIFTYDNTTLSTVPTYYINGAIQAPGTVITAPSGTPPTDTLATPTTIGNRAAADRGWNGQISHVRIWNRVLSADEVAQLFADPWCIYDKNNLNASAFRLAGGNVYNVSIAESGSAADALSSKGTLVANDNEAGSAVDTVSSSAVEGAAISESGAGADTVGGNVTGAAAIAESGTAAETVTAGAQYSAAISEAGSAADSQSVIVRLSASVSESGAAAETVASQAVLAAAIAETGAAADTPASTAVEAGAISESGAGVDTVSSKGTLAGAITEAGAAAETVSSQGNLVGAIVEIANAQDTDSAPAPGANIIAEGLTAIDTVSAQVVGAGTISESGAAIDTPSARVTGSAAIAETATAGDTVSALMRMVAAMVEAGLAIDAPSALAVLHVTIVESGTAIDSVDAPNLNFSATPCNTLKGAPRTRLLYGGRNLSLKGQARVRSLGKDCC